MAGSQGSGTAARIAAIGMALLAYVHYTMAASYVVGDSAGWNIGVDYKTWASHQSFKIGDKLQFKYTTALHSVFQTTEENYKTCTTTGRLMAYTSGDDTVIITNSTMYFICPTPNHCSGGGMALAITASGTPLTPVSAPAPKSSPSPPASSPPSSPSGSPPTSPSPPITSSPPSPPGSSPSAAITLRSGSIVLLSGVLLSGLLVLF